MTICLAQAYSASGDYGTARAELERLLSTNPRDTKLLHQLSMLAESEGDPSTAAKFQKQLVDLAPGDEANARLAQLYIQAGEIAEAEALWTRLTADGQPESHRVLMAVDSLLGSGKKEAVLGITENLLRKRPDNWEALYREGQTLAALGRAGGRREPVPDDPRTEGKRRRGRLRRQGQETARDAAVGRPQRRRLQLDELLRPDARPSRSRIGSGGSTTSEVPRASTAGSRCGSAWSPDDLGQARMAAVGWLLQPGDQGRDPGRLARRASSGRREGADRPQAPLEPLLPPAPPARVRRDSSRPPRGSQGSRRPTPPRSSPSSTPCRSAPTRARASVINIDPRRGRHAPLPCPMPTSTSSSPRTESLKAQQTRLGPRRDPDRGRRGAEAIEADRGPRPILQGGRRDLERRRVRRQHPPCRRRARRRRRRDQPPRPLRPPARHQARLDLQPLRLLRRLLHAIRAPRPTRSAGR